MRIVLAVLFLSVTLGAQVPPPPFVGHTLVVDVPAPAPDIAEAFVYTIYLDALSTGVTLTGVTCTPTVPLVPAPTGNVFACTGELPKLAPGSFHTVRYTVGTKTAPGPLSAPLGFVYQPASQMPPPVTNPRIR